MDQMRWRIQRVGKSRECCSPSSAGVRPTQQARANMGNYLLQWPTETSTLLCTHTFILTILTHRHTERPYMTIVYALWVACAFLSFPLSRRVKGSPVMLYNSNIIIIQLCIFLQTPFYLHINILSRYSLRSIDQQATKWWKYVWVWFYFLSLGWNNYDETE